ncbi:odorant receptor 4-like [Neodiprion virginianus]|uniref:odorant receptor 4-like n=1 Tax=Neodiprion virginianus TaxID=2961670 RepID=UPI001EE706DE|nr:odorant receptor 4-like [Neodiprion virginianus]
MAKNFIRVAVLLVASSSVVYFAKPLCVHLTSIQENDTILFNLPYRVHLFHNISNVAVYSLIYTLQAPLVLIATFGYTGSDCLMVTLTLHVCGELSVLANRVENLNCDTQGCKENIRAVVSKHVRLIRMARSLEDAFNTVLLGQLFGGTFLICFLGYSVLANTTEGQETDLLNFSLYGFSVVVLLFVYCYIGDCLTNENVKLRNAFFNCRWYNLPTKESMMFVTCIIQSQKPLHLTAGKFYVFSLSRFSDVIRSSVAYLSVLRNLM